MQIVRLHQLRSGLFMVFYLVKKLTTALMQGLLLPAV